MNVATGIVRVWMTAVLLAGAILMLSCSRVVVSETDVDTPREQYLSGMQKLGADDLKGAEEAFNRAIELNKKQPYGHAGRAFLEVKRTNYREARKAADKAIKCDKTFADAHAVKGYILTARKHGDDWYEKALESFARALELEPENERALFMMGECHLKAQKYGDALELYRKVRDGGEVLKKKAGERAALTERIIDVAPVPSICAVIMLDETIDRGDMARLVVDAFRIGERLKEYRPQLFGQLFDGDMADIADTGFLPPDMHDHPARSAVRMLVTLGVGGLDVFPNEYYYPGNLITRGQCAVILQSLLVFLSGDFGAATVYIGDESRCSDIRPDYYAFNAITLCVDRGLMKYQDMERRKFSPDATVSGVEAFAMLRRLELLLASWPKPDRSG